MPNFLFDGAPLPLPESPPNPPSTIFQLFACILAMLLWFESIVFVLPEKWRDKFSELQFGPLWTAKGRARP